MADRIPKASHRGDAPSRGHLPNAANHRWRGVEDLRSRPRGVAARHHPVEIGKPAGVRPCTDVSKWRVFSKSTDLLGSRRDYDRVLFVRFNLERLIIVTACPVKIYVSGPTMSDGSSRGRHPSNSIAQPWHSQTVR